MTVKTIKVDYLARVEGEGAIKVVVRDGRLKAPSSEYSSRRASSKPCCVAATSPRRPTLQRGSAESARSPTR